MRWLETAAVFLLLPIGVSPSAGELGLGAEQGGAVRSSEAEGARLVEVVVPGPLKQVEAFESRTGERSLVLLVEPADESEGPRFVYDLRLGAPEALSDLPVVLPPGADSLASLDLNRDGALELLVGEPGRIFRLTGEGKLELALESEGVDLKARARSAIDGATDDDELVLGAVGRAGRYALDADSGRLELVVQWDLPMDARMQRSWLRLSSPRVSALPSGGDGGGFHYVAGPVAISDRRLSTLILESTEGSKGQVIELWSRLPGPESVEESRYAILDGEIVLLVTTIHAEKRGIFEKEKFRILRLSEDRSRSGATPILELETRTRNWHRSSARVLDLNGDEIDDVVLVQPKGLGAGKLVVEAFSGTGDGAFEKKPRRTTLQVETEVWDYGEDLDLDGIPDLVLLEDETLLVFTGIPAGSSELVVRENPSWRVPVGDVDDSLKVLDVQGDRRPEIVLIERTGRGFESEESGRESTAKEPSEDPDKPDRGRLSLVILAQSPVSDGLSR